MRLGWFNYETFDIKFYESKKAMERGNLSEIIPGKVIAMSSPYPHSLNADGWRVYTPKDYTYIFKPRGVRAVIRLNEETYDPEYFIKSGIRHYDLIHPDGSCPNPDIVTSFIEILDKESSVAVHCMAGLGRTGTLIGCYALRQYDITARDFIAWCRIARPGSVIGP